MVKQKGEGRRDAKPGGEEVAYRAVTLGGEHRWAVVDGRGSEIFRGDARAAALIASRLTRPSR